MQDKESCNVLCLCTWQNVTGRKLVKMEQQWKSSVMYALYRVYCIRSKKLRCSALIGLWFGLDTVHLF